MIRPRFRVALALAFTMTVLPPASRPASADWRSEPVLLQANGYACQQVAVCDDGGLGGIVVWEDRRSAYGGPLRSSHILASGELDPGWVNAGIVYDVDFNRALLRAFPDGAGGALLTWMEGTALRFLRVEAGGVASSGSRVIVTVPMSAHPPRVVSDGQGGLYVGWLSYQPSTFRVLRVGGDGLPSPGWAATGKPFWLGLDEMGNPTITSTGSIAPAPDGGVWIVYAGYAVDPEGFIQPGPVRLARLAPTGAGVSGWARRIAGFPAETMPCEARYSEQGWEFSSADLVDVGSDDAGGVYVLHGDGVVGDPLAWPNRIAFVPRLHHLDATKQAADGWPEEGRVPACASPGPFYSDFGAEASYRVWAIAGGRALLGLASEAGTAGPFYGTLGIQPDGSCGNGYGGGYIPGIEFAHGAAGVAYVASFHPEGPKGPCDGTAYVACAGTNGASFWRMPVEGQFAHYSDVGVAALADGGAVFAWGEAGAMNGLFAVRLGGRPGLDVPGHPPAATSRLSLRFVAGAGLRASAVFGGAGEARLLVADVAGRAVARETFEAGEGAREWTISGTALLAPGLYFSRVQRGAEVLTARVVVTR